MLITTTVWLILRIRRKRDSMQLTSSSRQVFNKEICALQGILSVFSTSYLIRALWDTFYKPSETTFDSLSGAVVLGIVFDFIPIMLIITLHFKNFRGEIAIVKQPGDEISGSVITNRTSVLRVSQVSSTEQGTSQKLAAAAEVEADRDCSSGVNESQ